MHHVIAHQAFPFQLKVPNAETLAAMTEAEEIAQKHRARFDNADALFDELEKDNG